MPTVSYVQEGGVSNAFWCHGVWVNFVKMEQIAYNDDCQTICSVICNFNCCGQHYYHEELHKTEPVRITSWNLHSNPEWQQAT